MSKPQFVLIGPPGAGKSTVGKALAKLLQTSFIDSDNEIERAESKKISEIFLEQGEKYFREIERSTVLRLLVSHEGVLSLGGGSVMNDEVASELKQSGATVVFLDVGIAQASHRVGFNKDRPMLLVNPRQQWLALMEKRRPRYVELANIIISTDSHKPAEIASLIMSTFKARPHA